MPFAARLKELLRKGEMPAHRSFGLLLRYLVTLKFGTVGVS